MTLRIERYKHTRHWALYDGPELVVVTVYRRGALEVLRRLQAQAPGEAAAGTAVTRPGAARLPLARQPRPRRQGAAPRPAGALPSSAPPAA